MADGLYDEAIVDVVGPDALLSEPYPVKVVNSLNESPITKPHCILSSGSHS